MEGTFRGELPTLVTEEEFLRGLFFRMLGVFLTTVSFEGVMLLDDSESFLTCLMIILGGDLEGRILFEENAF